MSLEDSFYCIYIPGFSVAAPWAFNWFLDGNANKVDISIVGTNGKFFLINAHGVLRRMGAVTEIPGKCKPIYMLYTSSRSKFESNLSGQVGDSTLAVFLKVK